MEKLLDEISALAHKLSPDRIKAIALQIQRMEAIESVSQLTNLAGTSLVKEILNDLFVALKTTTVCSSELAVMLLTASHVYNKTKSSEVIELVWTGPKTSYVSTRQTEQVLLQVINAAREHLFITSFVAYDITSIVKAMNEASDRGVAITMLLESASKEGGNISFDVIGKMKSLIPSASVYAWTQKIEPFLNGSVHAKVAVADKNSCFVTSANLTGFAMEKNMEAGVLITGGEIPRLLNEHLIALIETNVIVKV